MKVHHFSVVPKVPEALSPLREIMFNLWWTWNPEAVDLFRRIDHDMWSKSSHNPILMLGKVSQQRLMELSEDLAFLAHMKRVHGALLEYLQNCPSQKGSECPLHGSCLAYFSMEYAIHECLPIYSGGLGALAGDHVKSASDLGLPLVAVGLLYRQGHYHQYLSYDGWQKEVYLENDFHNMAVTLVRGEDGSPVTVDVRIGDHLVKVRAWEAKVGRVPLYLLDVNFDDNPDEVREITSRLYAPGASIRLQQEIVLGVGGVRFLTKIGLGPCIFHMNEGHSAFLAIERASMAMRDYGLNFEEAIEVIRAGNIFTTHTPVQAGIDHFTPELLRSHLGRELSEMGIALEEVLRLGVGDSVADPKEIKDLSMAVLAIKTSIYRNGVSRLHGEVSRRMWADVWRGTPADEVPIGHVTNGIHVRTWLSDEMARLYYRYLGPQWMNETSSSKVWERIYDIPDNELWRAKERLKQRLIGFVRRTLPKQLARRGCSQSEILSGEQVLDPEALTIGFARRFATYKRATLIFRDIERLSRILNDKNRPVQIVFAGKAHPADDEGKKFIQQIIKFCRQKEFRDKVVFVEDYDINIARYLVQGVDVWLNNPRRPLEACGTSGMKVIPNGGLHLSVLDGWWDEAYTNEVGWAIGNGEDQHDYEAQDQLDSFDIYEVLEQDIVPLFYDRVEEEVPTRWVKKMKVAMSTLVPVFNTDRMVSQYVEQYYKPAIKFKGRISAENHRAATHLTKWKQKVRAAWPKVGVTEVREPAFLETPIGDPLEISCTVALGGLATEDVRVEAYWGQLDSKGEISGAKSHALRFDYKKDSGEVVFGGTIFCEDVGSHGFAIRVRPTHPNLIGESETGLVVWG